jgi:hypothetical protein
MDKSELIESAVRRRHGQGRLQKESLENQVIDTSVIYTTPNELARELKVSHNAIRYYLDNKIIDSFYFGARRFIHPDEAKKLKRLAASGLIFRVGPND